MATKSSGRAPYKRWKCRLFHGDCFELFKRLPDRSVHAVITDPPYGSTDCEWDSAPDLQKFWSEVDRVTTETSIVAIFAAQPFTTDVINANRRAFRYDLIWDKHAPVGFLNANRQPLRVHEQLLIFCRRPGASVYEPQFFRGAPYKSLPRAATTQIYRSFKPVATINDGRRHPTSILRFAKPSRGERIHPTQKPVKLLNWIVRSYTRRCQVILDPFMGSGSTGEAALAADRRFIGMERDRRYFELAAKRLRKSRRVHLEAQ